jgi:hypothetical protein
LLLITLQNSLVSKLFGLTFLESGEPVQPEGSVVDVMVATSSNSAEGMDRKDVKIKGLEEGEIPSHKVSSSYYFIRFMLRHWYQPAGTGSNKVRNITDFPYRYSSVAM